MIVVIGQLGNADIIQPGLIGLQPSLDEYMDTLEPLPSLSGEYMDTLEPPPLLSGEYMNTLEQLSSFSDYKQLENASAVPFSCYFRDDGEGQRQSSRFTRWQFGYLDAGEYTCTFTKALLSVLFQQWLGVHLFQVIS